MSHLTKEYTTEGDCRHYTDDLKIYHQSIWRQNSDSTDKLCKLCGSSMVQRNAIRILDTKELVDEDIKDAFLKWIPGVQAEELNQLKKIYSFDMIAFEMTNWALEYGNITALSFIRDFYRNPNYFAYDKEISKKLFSERNGIVELC